MTRIFPSLFRDSHVHRLALFFQNLRASLAALSPRPGEEPHIVVLTPGPRNETYFEHSYLASYLGYTLARGDDLTVRDGRVWLRSMGRLQPVDVILRRVDDDYCDPLELRADSRLGVPGLAEVVRRGNVVVANPLGAGALENPGLNAFLPAIARHFLGQDLLLPSAPSWWCGQARERDYVLANLQRLVIKPIHREPGMQPVFGARLSAAEREALAGRIRAQPHRYVGQEQLACSVAPALVDGRLEPRPLIQRGFLVAREDGYVVLPGGLARSAPATDSWIVSNQAGAVSKDTWVLATEPEKQTSLLQTPLTEPQRSEPPLASATADNAFWLGRYAERAEQGLRSLRVVLRAYRQAEEYGNPRDRRALEPLLETLTFTLGAGPGFLGDEEAARALRAEPRGELQALLCDPQRVGSVAQNLHGMLEAAFATRDRLSADAWRIIGDLRLRLDNLAADPPEPAAALRETLDPLLTELMALVGIGAESTVRSQAWRFLDIGRRIERALQVGALTQALLGPARDEVLEQALLDALLQATDSGVGYRRVHADQLAVSPVLRWVLQESTNPRALGYQLERLRGQLEGLPRDPDEEARSRELRLLVDAHARLFLAEPAGLADAPQGYRGELQGLLFGIAESLRGVSDALTLRYFVDMRGPQQLNAPGGSR
jgi:uncharacterized alpha-E superfamily protein